MAVDLRTIIPGVDTIRAPLAAILGDQGSGLIGVSARIEGQDFGGSAGALGGRLQSELGGLLPTEGGAPFSGALGAISQLAGTTAPPADLLGSVQRPLAEIQGALARIPEIVELIGGVAGDVEAARSGDLAPLVQRAGAGLNSAVQAISGPDLAGFDEWRRYLVELADLLRPLVDAGGTPDELRARLLTFALGRVRDAILGVAPEVTLLRSSAPATLGALLPDVPDLGLASRRDAVLARLDAIRAAAETDTGDLGALIAAYQADLRALVARLDGALATMEAAGASPLLTPGGVAALAGRELDRVRATRIVDYSNVVERVESFFATIEGAVDQVDLSFIGTEVTRFFGQIQELIGRINPESIGQELDSLAARVDDLVTRLQELLLALTSRIQGWLGQLSGQLDQVFGQLGAQGADGRFHFAFESDLESFYQRLDSFIQGDPSRPDAFSLRGALQGFQQTFTGLLAEAEAALADLAQQLLTARDQLAASLGEVRAQLEEVDPRAVMDQAKAALEGAFEQIGGLEFDPVVDPIVAELEEARDTLAGLDLSSLNDILKEALKVALDAVRSSNFDVSIRQALLVEFDELLVLPRQVLAELGDKLNELIAKVAALRPRDLLAPVQQELDRLTAALDIDVAGPLRPLADVYNGVIDQVRALDPSRLLAPLVEAFGQLGALLDGLRPEALLEPLQRQIDELSATIRAVDLDALLGPANAVFGEMNRFLDGIDPAALLQPLNEPFALLERTLERLRPAVLLAPISDIMDQIGGLTDQIPDAVIDEIRALYDEAVARADNLDPALLFPAIAAPLRALRQRLAELQPGTLLLAVHGSFGATRAAVAAADSRRGTSFSLTLDAQAPTVAFGVTIGRFDQIAARLDDALAGLDPAPLAERFAEARQRLEELLPRAIRDDMTAGRLRALLGLMDPARWITRLDTIYDRILGKVRQLSPAVVIEPLAATYQALRTALASFDIGLITGRIEALLRRVSELVGSLSLRDMVAPLLGSLERARAIARGIDPAPLIAALRARFEALIGLFREFGPEPVIAAIQDAVEALAGEVRQLFDLDVLLEPLLGVFEAIEAILGGLDAGELVGVLDDKLDKLRDELDEALVRVGGALQDMLGAVPLGGGASAGASVSGSIG